ncbi:accessory factor UbiK family protein [Legionella gresilensis]|uniref:accessory factor UbiK family protein n=1 Tax=Legionella gresilensis TaxID=91823 RepID=UPI0010419FB4|nr:accessory factor UbiK family protein [Legionella gresilensis]
MLDSKLFDDLTRKLFATLPLSLQNLEKETRQKFKEVLQSTFSRLDLVTREEFDIQLKVLARTREKLENLQAQVNELIEKKNNDLVNKPD